MNVQYSNIVKKILVIGTICLLLIIQTTACNKKETEEISTTSLSIETAELQTVVAETTTEKITEAITEAMTTEGTTTEPITTQTPTTEPTTKQPIVEQVTTQTPTIEETKIQETTSIQPTTESVGLPVVEASSAPVISVRTNNASGVEVYSNNGTTVDASNKDKGYIMIKHDGGSNRIKLQIINVTTTYTYDLNSNGKYEAFPLQMGDGTYTIRTLENVTGTSYSILYSTEVAVAINSSLSPYLYPSQRVRFNSSMEAVKKSYDLTAGLTSDEEKVNAIYNYVINTIKYDYSKISNLTSTYLSNADTTLANESGICLDYSVLVAVMLRAQGIPTQVVYGSATEASWHAWNKIYYNGGWVLKDATFEAGGGKGTNYTESQRY